MKKFFKTSFFCFFLMSVALVGCSKDDGGSNNNNTQGSASIVGKWYFYSINGQVITDNCVKKSYLDIAPSIVEERQYDSNCSYEEYIYGYTYSDGYIHTADGSVKATVNGNTLILSEDENTAVLKK